MPRPRGGLDDFFFKPAIPGSGLGAKIAFEAHIVGLNDASSPSWEENFDMGRADPKVFYRGFSRSINVSFMVVAVTKEEHRGNYDLMKRLALLTYPIYKAGLGYNAPHVFYKIGKLLQGYGYMSSIDFNWEPDTAWIDEKPIITEANVVIKVLGNNLGERPEYKGGNYNYFGI
jgi:hypothetical protein